MAETKTKTAGDITTGTSASTSQYIILTDDSGNTNKVSLANLETSLISNLSSTGLSSLKTALIGDLDLNALNDGVFIVYHALSGNGAQAILPSAWPAKQTAGEVAEGVMIYEAGKTLVIAPTEASLLWSSAAVSGGGTTTTDRLVAMADMDGRTNTTAQLEHEECSGESYAAGYCNAYSITNTNGSGYTAGYYWLPSLGEMMMIYSRLRAINYALSLIDGATQISTSGHYWTSTEQLATTVWRLYMSTGTVSCPGKTNHEFRVRPVSAFIA